MTETTKRLLWSIVLLAALVVPADRAPLAADPSAVLTLVPGTSIEINGQPSAEAKLFTNPEKTVLLACPPGDYVYRIYRKDKKVVALRRPTVMVMGEKCRPMEGAVEQPITGHLYAETPAGVSFNDHAGRKIAVTLPAGTLR